jgi:hypothetical protein
MTEGRSLNLKMIEIAGGILNRPICTAKMSIPVRVRYWNPYVSVRAAIPTKSRGTGAMRKILRTDGMSGTMIDESVDKDPQPSLVRQHLMLDCAKTQMYRALCSMSVAYNSFVRALARMKEIAEPMPPRTAPQSEGAAAPQATLSTWWMVIVGLDKAY